MPCPISKCLKCDETTTYCRECEDENNYTEIPDPKKKYFISYDDKNCIENCLEDEYLTTSTSGKAKCAKCDQITPNCVSCVDGLTCDRCGPQYNLNKLESNSFTCVKVCPAKTYLTYSP